jgi:signal transduction histidine kinase
LRESGYDVVGELSGDELDSEKIMRTDAQNLMRIIDNVFSNIYKYADKGRPVSITVKNENDRLVLIEFENYVSKVASHAESNGIGLKTCSRLGKLIADGFEYRLTDDVFKVSILIAIYDPKK